MLHRVKQGETDLVLEVDCLRDWVVGGEADLQLGNETSKWRKRLSVRRQPLKALGGLSQTALQ